MLNTLQYLEDLEYLQYLQVVYSEVDHLYLMRCIHDMLHSGFFLCFLMLYLTGKP